MKTKMHLAYDLSYAHMDGTWRTPGSWSHQTFPNVGMYEDIARIAERGCLDMLFFGDGSGIPSTWQGSERVAAKWGIQWPRQDMSPYIANMSRVTKHVGFGLTYASTFMPPFYVARLLNSLDWVTGGRIAFNVIASTRRADAANYGFDTLMEHNSRYDRMEEFIDVCNALWTSVESDAFIWDRETGVVCDPDKVHPIDHVGQFFKVRGPLNTPPSPQGRPVLIQAGTSPRGIAASAHFADHIFASAPPRPVKVKHRKDLDVALRAKGRDPEKVGIIFSMTAVIGESESEAAAKKEKMLDTMPAEAIGAYLSYNSAYDFSKLSERFVLSDLNQEIIAAQVSPNNFVSRLIQKLGHDGEITREEFFHHGRRTVTGYDSAIAGTPAQVADFMEGEFEATDSRGGFMLSHPYSSPRSLMDVVDFLVPELQRRGRFRTEYEGRTLRENLAA